MVGGSGRGELAGLLSFFVLFLLLIEDRFQRVVAEVAAADEPLVVLFDDDARCEPDERAVVGEDADDVGAPADLAVDPLERIRRAQLRPVVCREAVEGEQVLLGLFQERRNLRQRLAQSLEGVPTSSRAASPEPVLKIGRSSAATIPCWSLR